MLFQLSFSLPVLSSIIKLQYPLDCFFDSSFPSPISLLTRDFHRIFHPACLSASPFEIFIVSFQYSSLDYSRRTRSIFLFPGFPFPCGVLYFFSMFSFPVYIFRPWLLWCHLATCPHIKRRGSGSMPST